jgi:hypothetical protein
MEGGLNRGRICNRAYGFKIVQILTIGLFVIQMLSAAENIKQVGPN